MNYKVFWYYLGKQSLARKSHLRRICHPSVFHRPGKKETHQFLSYDLQGRKLRGATVNVCQVCQDVSNWIVVVNRLIDRSDSYLKVNQDEVFTKFLNFLWLGNFGFQFCKRKFTSSQILPASMRDGMRTLRLKSWIRWTAVARVLAVPQDGRAGGHGECNCARHRRICLALVRT